MNNLNNNFLEDGVEYEYVDEGDNVDGIIEEIVEEVEEETDSATQTSSVINEAMKRIEQAKLYEAMLNHQLFGPGSARPEIIKSVKKEIKDFILYRLEVLLGIRQEGNLSTSGTASTPSPFDKEEVIALKDIAKKLITKNNAIASVPKINSITTSQPAIATLEVQHVPIVNEAIQNKVVRRVVRKVVKGPVPNGRIAVPVKSTNGRRKSENVSVLTGQDLSQAVSTARPPVKMPSQAQMDMLNAQQAESNARGAGQTSGLANAIKQTLK